MEKEDWGESLDDFEPGDWEEYLGGPNDAELEAKYEHYNFENVEDSPPHFENLPESRTEIIKSYQDNEEIGGRQEEIIKWLALSKLAITFKNGKGFFVPKGPQIRLTNNDVMDLLEWLNDEGINGGKTIAGYSIGYTKPGGKYGEKLSFFKKIVDTPFSQISNA